MLNYVLICVGGYIFLDTRHAKRENGYTFLVFANLRAVLRFRFFMFYLCTFLGKGS